MALPGMNLRENTLITAATVYAGEPAAHEILVAETTDCGDCEIYLVTECDSHWPRAVAIVAASSWESAWEAAIDDLPTVAPDELHDAYGCTAEEWAAHHAAADALVAECGATARGDYEWPDLADGYHYQGNASGTGIVHTAYLGMDPLTREMMEHFRLRLQIRGWDAADAERAATASEAAP